LSPLVEVSRFRRKKHGATMQIAEAGLTLRPSW
jgi:hypothetical protein